MLFSFPYPPLVLEDLYNVLDMFCLLERTALPKEDLRLELDDSLPTGVLETSGLSTKSVLSLKRRFLAVKLS